MGVIVGVVVGYMFGASAGAEGWEEIKEAWKVIRASQEVREMVAGGLSLARELLAQGGKTMAARGSAPRLRSVA